VHIAKLIAACILLATTVCRAPRDEQDAKGSCCTDTVLLDAAQAALPFQLTHAQQRSLDQILADMAKPFPMNRLLQVRVPSCCRAARRMSVSQA
jgi:RecG-like helicase